MEFRPPHVPLALASVGSMDSVDSMDCRIEFALELRQVRLRPVVLPFLAYLRARCCCWGVLRLVCSNSAKFRCGSYACSLFIRVNAICFRMEFVKSGFEGRLDRSTFGWFFGLINVI